MLFVSVFDVIFESFMLLPLLSLPQHHPPNSSQPLANEICTQECKSKGVHVVYWYTFLRCLSSQADALSQFNKPSTNRHFVKCLRMSYATVTAIALFILFYTISSTFSIFFVRTCHDGIAMMALPSTMANV